MQSTPRDSCSCNAGSAVEDTRKKTGRRVPWGMTWEAHGLACQPRVLQALLEDALDSQLA